MKRFEIRYNPFSNRIHFRQENNIDGSDSVEWIELENDSSFLKYQNRRCIFENCAEDIVELINRFINTSDALVIEFIGTEEDFDALRIAIMRDSDPKSRNISCAHKERYPSSSDVLSKIRGAYEQIKTEFDDYIDNDDLSEDDDRTVIGKAITKFQETVKAEIPVCVIGNYSVGKSALVNALIGLEILPSHSNSTTAKNVLIQNGDHYSMSFDYHGASYNAVITDSQVTITCSEERDEGLIESLLAGTEYLLNEESVLHQIIENLNKETSSEDSKLAEIDGSVRITVPFRRSELDTEKYSFVFIDTPGSNNSDEAQAIHRENLERLMDEQTNALPIFVMGRNSLDSNDANDLRTLLENKEAGFAVQNCIIAISMSDQLVEQQLSEELPQKVKDWLNHPTIIFVSPVAAIGEKKTDKNTWIDQTYRQIYERKMSDLVEVCPPNYNETPCGRKMAEERVKAITSLLYASGVPSLETEINYFAFRFAEYKKCSNGRQYLLEAMQIADSKLKEAKDSLEEDKKAKINEQNDFRAALKSKINKIRLPSVNKVIKSVSSKYSDVLSSYCETVEPQVRSLWESREGDKSFDAIEEAMARHCQKNLYDAHGKGIKKSLEKQFIELSEDYMTDVRKGVSEEYVKISDDARGELEDIFDGDDNRPELQDVGVGRFERIKFNLLKWIPVPYIQNLLIKQYSTTFKEKLLGTGNEPGVFSVQCISKPAEEYDKQIKKWNKAFLASIDETLNKDNAILSDLDEKIKAMEDRINDLETRIHKLADVRTMLQDVLPEEKVEDKENG